MAMSNKEAAIRAIQALPDDASTADIMYTMYVRFQIERGLRDIEAGNTISHEDVKREIDAWLRSVVADGAATPDSHASLVLGEVESDGDSDLEDATYYLEREGWETVLVPDRPVPPITADLVNELIQETRREREDRWLGLTEEDGE